MHSLVVLARLPDRGGRKSSISITLLKGKVLECEIAIKSFELRNDNDIFG